jgi:hypothetical protein
MGNGIRSFLAFYDVYIIPAKFKRKVKVPKVYSEEEQPLYVKHIWQILLNCHNRRRKLFKDTHLVKLELLSNTMTIDSALNYITNKQQQKGLALGHTANKENDEPVTARRLSVF